MVPGISNPMRPLAAKGAGPSGCGATKKSAPDGDTPTRFKRALQKPAGR